MPKKAVGIYFSPTGATKKYITTLLEATGLPTERLDLTPAGSAPKREFSAEELCVFGFPVYAGRIPTVLRERLLGLRGHGTPAVLAAVYGNRHYDDSLLELSDLLPAQGFVPVGGAAVIARHTYGEVATERPTILDLEEAEHFMKELLARETLSPVSFPGNRPYREGGHGRLFKPETSARCISCGVCAARCPVGAIAADCRTVSDACISCFRCVRECPLGAKVVTSEEYKAFAEKLTEKLTPRRENEFFL